MPNADLAAPRPLATARIASALPGRLRLRVVPARGGRPQLAAAAEALVAHSFVSAATANLQTGSLLVQYDTAQHDAVWIELQQLGLNVPTVPAPDAQPAAEPAARVTNGLARLNRFVGARTGGNDLRTLVPLGFGLMALRQFITDDQRLSDAPWYVLAWYASGTFQKYNQPGGESHHG